MPTTSSVRRRPAAAAAACLVAFTATSIWSGSADGAGADPVEASVMAWIDDTDPTIVVDGTAECDGAVPDLVAYRNDRLVLRVPAAVINATVRLNVNTALGTLYGTVGFDYVQSLERITFTVNPPIDDVVSVTLKPRPNGQPHQIPQAARQLRGDTGREVSPDYALHTSSHYSYYEPYGNPRPATGLTVPRAVLTRSGLPLGSGVKIEVFDTGLSSTQGLPMTTMYSAIDNELVNRDKSGDPDLADYKHAGHGRAIAGVIATVAPGAQVEVVRVNERSGVLTDVTAARRIAEVMNAMPKSALPDVLVMSFATAPCVADATGVHMTPVGTGAVAELVERLNATKTDGMVIVAAAGNMNSTTEHYPAAFESVVGVGALDGKVGADTSPWTNPARTAPIASFSNTGDWVDAYAAGVGLPTTHVNGVQFESDGPFINGIAEVDGSSFSAPLVGAHIAELMSLGPLRADEAAEALLGTGIAVLPECGTTKQESGTAIVLSSWAATIAAPATGTPVTC